jgi:hypothetical protein
VTGTIGENSIEAAGATPRGKRGKKRGKGTRKRNEEKNEEKGTASIVFGTAFGWPVGVSCTRLSALFRRLA